MIVIGLFRVAILLLVIFPILLVSIYTWLGVPNYAYVIIAGVLSLVYIVHSRRKDFNFIIKISKYPFATYLAEYFVFSIPLLILFILKQQFYSLFIYVLCLIGLSFTPRARIKLVTFSKFLKLIPQGMFEWQSGFRKNFIFIIIFYLIGFLGIWKLWFSAISVFFLIISVCSFYSEFESRKILESAELPPKAFLSRKLKTHVKSFIIFVSPIFVLSFVHYTEALYVFVSFAMVINCLVAAILLKYAFYAPGNVSGFIQVLGSIILFVALVFPLSILIVALNIFLYFKAKNNLKIFLDAYN